MLKMTISGRKSALCARLTHSAKHGEIFVWDRMGCRSSKKNEFYGFLHHGKDAPVVKPVLWLEIRKATSSLARRARPRSELRKRHLPPSLKYLDVGFGP